jgi:hypothetical protein
MIIDDWKGIYFATIYKFTDRGLLDCDTPLRVIARLIFRKEGTFCDHHHHTDKCQARRYFGCPNCVGVPSDYKLPNDVMTVHLEQWEFEWHHEWWLKRYLQKRKDEKEREELRKEYLKVLTSITGMMEELLEYLKKEKT